MALKKGNRAIAEHSALGKSLLLFRSVKQGLRFEGEMVCEGYHIERAVDRTGVERDAIVFELRSLEAINEALETQVAIPAVALSELYQRALASAVQNSTARSKSERNIYQRSQDVRAYVLARAAGKCEGCEKPAPFKRADGTAYLEPHHMRRVSDGGPDHPQSVIALCPNCHRRVHAGADSAAYNSALVKKILDIEVARNPT
jgi:5-methylcytosine-specific restriction protein A